MSKTKINKKEISYISLCFSIILYFTYYFSINSYLTSIGILRSLLSVELYGTIFFLLITILAQKTYKINQFVILCIVVILGAIVSRNVDNSQTFLILLLFMIAGLNMEPDRIYRFCFRVNIFFLITIILCSKIGIIEDRVSNALGHAPRHCLGFTAPNAPLVLFFSMLLFIAYKKEKIKIIHYILFLSATFYLYKEADMRAPFWGGIAMLAILYVARNIEETFWKRKFLQNLSYIVIPLCLIASFVLPVLYSMGVSWIQQLDVLTSGRIQLGVMAFENYGVKPFGQLMQFNYGLSGTYNENAVYFYLDSSYLKYIFQYGYVFVGLILYAYHRAIKYAVFTQNVYLLLSLVIALFFFVWNPQLVYIPYNPFIITIIGYILRSTHQRKRLMKIFR